MITAERLVYWFYYMYNNGWGYIWGKSGQTWTQKQQDAATREMTKKYGQRWVGKVVTDCSGAFVYAFEEEGGSIYHGSNTIWKQYCSSKGKLVHGVREDGQPMKPGTAVFLYDGSKRHHIGCYVGGDTVIEAKGTINGVVVSRLDHWDEWGELKDVDYSNSGDIQPPDVKPPRRMHRQGCKGEDVHEMQVALNNWNQGVKAIKEDGKFGPNTLLMVKMFQDAEGLKADGIVGPQTWAKLEPYMDKKDDPEPEPEPKQTFKIVAELIKTVTDQTEIEKEIHYWFMDCPFFVQNYEIEL
jgi:hypothetical protein